MSTLMESVISLCVMLGALFVLLGALGLAKLPDFYSRLHAPTKASTLGVGGIALGSLLYFYDRGNAGWHELLLTLFLFMTAPLTTHMLAQAALRRRVDVAENGARANDTRHF